MKTYSLLRFDDLGYGSTLNDWLPWIEFIHAKNIRPVVCVIPDNIDFRIGPSDHADFFKIINKFKSIDAIFLAHGFTHNLSQCGDAIFKIYKQGELLNLCKKDFENFRRVLVDASNRFEIKFEGYAPPAHMFDKSFMEFVIYNKHYIPPVINDLYGRSLYLSNDVFFVPLISKFSHKMSEIETISVHPRIDSVGGKIYKNIFYRKYFYDPRKIYRSIDAVNDNKKHPVVNRFDLCLTKFKFIVKSFLD